MDRLPLENVKIIEVSAGEPAAFCAGWLGDLGADIFRLELPGRHPNYPQQVWDQANRNKRSILLNLGRADERKLFEKILRESDVFLEDQPIASLEALQMDHESLIKINPGLIYCSISCYGKQGPYKEIPGDEICAQALGGMIQLQDNTLGNIGNALEERPEIPDVMVAGTKAAFHGAVGILSALLARRKTGLGQWIDISLLDGVVSQKSIKPMFRLPTEPMGFQVYQTKDNKYVVTAAIEPWTWKKLVEKLGVAELADIAAKSQEERLQAISILQKVFKTKTREDWLEVFRGVDTELSPAYSYGEVILDPHVQWRKILLPVEQEKGGKIVKYGIPMKLSRTPGQVRHAAPAIGQDTAGTFRNFPGK